MALAKTGACPARVTQHEPLCPAQTPLLQRSEGQPLRADAGGSVITVLLRSLLGGAWWQEVSHLLAGLS